MPGWLDMRETRRVRERVAVASSSLPYWNAEGIFTSTGWPTPVASEVRASSLPLAQKLALISDGKGEIFVQSEPSSDNDDPKPSRTSLKADRVGTAQLLSQMKPLRPKAAARRKQPKQGPLPVASASAAQMASKIRRQLLQMCRQAGISPGRLQVEEDQQDDLQEDQQPMGTPQVPKVPVEFPKKGCRPDLATQLRRATMERAQREREIQRRSRAVQTRQTRTVPEICIKMNPAEPTLVPKSVQLEGYHCQAAAKVKTQDVPKGQPTCPDNGFFPQGGLTSNAEDEIVIGGHHSETGEIFSDHLEQQAGSPSSDSRWRTREEPAASARQSDGPPPHQTHKTSRIKDQGEERLRERSSEMLGQEPGFDSHQPFFHFGDSGIHSRLQEAWSGQEKARPCEVPLQLRSVQPSTRAAIGARGESYDLTVFQALSRKAFGVELFKTKEEDQSEEAGEQDTPSRPISDLMVSEPPEAMEDGLDEPDLDPRPQENPLDHLEVAPEIGPLEPAAFEPSEAPSSIRSPSQDSDEEDFLRAATPVEPNGDTSDSDVGRSQELPDLPPYRPLPSLQRDLPDGSGDGAAHPRLAPKQLEEQFYTSLQILDSVHEHLAQVDLLSQQRVLHRQYTAQYEREAGLEAQMAQQAQLDSTIAWLETTRQAQQQLIQQLQCVEEGAQRSRQAFAADYEARELQRQEETEILERERLEREQSILERQREMLLLLGLTLDSQA